MHATGRVARRLHGNPDAVCALNPVRYVYKGNETQSTALTHSGDTMMAEGIEKPENYDEIPEITFTAILRQSAESGAVCDLTEYVGLVAQQAEIAMPELIRLEKGFIDGVKVDDVRQVNYTPLMFAMINAIKELRARVIELEATR